MSTIYALALKPLSGWVTPLQADTIFGHLCWQIKRNNDKEELDDFLRDMGAVIGEKKPASDPFFTASNGFPLGYIPRPVLEADFIKEQDGAIAQMSKDADAIKNFSKKTKYIPTKEIDGYAESFGGSYGKMIERREFLFEAAKTAPKILMGGIVKNSINRLTLATGGDSCGPFALPCHFLDAGEQKDGGLLWVLVKVFDEYKMNHYQIKTRLEQIFEEGYGKKKSIGMGRFEAMGWEKVEIQENKNGSHILLLSNFVPAADNPAEGMFETFVKYGKMGEERSIAGAGNFYKKPVIMINAGATFNVGAGPCPEYVGRMLQNICADKEVCHYGYGFTLAF